MCLGHSPDIESICLYYCQLLNYPLFYWPLAALWVSKIRLQQQQYSFANLACINSFFDLGFILHLFFLEPNAYRSMVGRAVNSTQWAQDYTKLRTLLQSVRYYNKAHLYGPNVGRPRKNAILLLDG